MIDDPNADSGSGAATLPLQVQVPKVNVIGNLENAETLAGLIGRTSTSLNQATQSNLETRDALATREAVSKNTTQDPHTGSAVLNFNGAISDLMKTSPTAAINLQMSMQQRQAEVAEKQAQLQQTQLANNLSRVNLVGQLVQHVNSQDDLDDLRTNMQKNPALYGGIPLESIPQTFNPQERDALVAQSMKASEAISQKIAAGHLSLQATKNVADFQQDAFTKANEAINGYRDDPHTKDYVKMVNTYTNFQSMKKTPDFSDGIKDRDLIYNFQNMINPDRSATGSTVEQDIEARSLMESLGIHIQGPMTGQFLSTSQRQQISGFIENKYKSETLQQQAVFNQAQNRLININAVHPGGQVIDPYASLPTYGGVVNHVPSTFNAAKPGNGAQPVNLSDMQKPQPKGGNLPNPPPAGQAGERKGIVSSASIEKAAQKRGISIEDAKAMLKAKGYSIEGE